MPKELQRLIRILVLLTGIPCLVIVVVVIVSFERGKSKDMIVFDNLLATPASITVDGQPLGDLEPAGVYGAVHLFKLPDALDGTRKISVTSAGKVVAEAELSTRPPAEDEHGYRGLFTIGAQQDYVIATVPYFAHDATPTESATLVRVAAPSPLAELPRTLEEFQISRIDTPFLDSQKMYGGDVMRQIHLCRVTGFVIGCSGFPSAIAPD